MSVSVGAQNELQALWCAGDDMSALFQRSFRLSRDIRHGRTPHPVDVRLSIHQGQQTVVRQSMSVSVAAPRACLLPGDQLLIVGGGCEWRPSGPDRNAILYDHDGQVLAEETWGDDISHLAVAPDDTIWVGYGSMAVWGSANGWGGPGPMPPGWPGLIRYEPDSLRPIWRYPRENPWGGVDSCDALNVADDATWVCHPLAHPIVRITERSVTGWHSRRPARGVSAIAVDYPHAALFGGDDDGSHDLLTLGRLTDDRFEIDHRYRVVMPDGTPIDRLKMIGRGPTLHTVVGNTSYQITLTDVRNARSAASWG